MHVVNTSTRVSACVDGIMIYDHSEGCWPKIEPMHVVRT